MTKNEQEDKKKHVLLRFDPEDFRKLKRKKEQIGYKSWEEFILKNLLDMSDDEIKRKRLHELTYEYFLELEGLSGDDKYILELIRVLIIKLLEGNRAKAKKIAKNIYEELNKEEE